MHNASGGISLSLTLELLQLIGSLLVPKTVKMNQDKIFDLHKFSIKNRISLLYLDTISKKVDLAYFRSLYEREETKYLKTLEVISRVSRLLTGFNIKHAVYKTLRPYKSTTVDIDTLIFGNRSKYKEAVKTMQKAGYKIIVCGPRSTTLLDQEANIGIDLYEQVAVSFVTYLDKEKLIDHVTTIRLPNGAHVEILKPEADLVAIIAHSIMKEQMYTLSEYYTFIHYLKQMDINDFIRIINQNSLTYAAKTHSTITALLHETAHKTIPKELQQILNLLGRQNFEARMLFQNHFKTPHRYHPLTIAKSFLEIMKWKKCRNSVATQLLHMLDPSFTRRFLKAFVKHVTRETY